MRLKKLLFLLSSFAFTWMASDPSNAEETEIVVPAREFYMAYQIDGIHVALDRAAVALVSNEGYQIQGSNSVQGDVNTISITFNGSPPALGTYNTNSQPVFFVVGHAEGVRGTVNVTTQSVGDGEFTITEITDTYIKGSFRFLADFGGENTPHDGWNITNGLFKAMIMQF